MSGSALTVPEAETVTARSGWFSAAMTRGGTVTTASPRQTALHGPAGMIRHSSAIYGPVQAETLLDDCIEMVNFGNQFSAASTSDMWNLEAAALRRHRARSSMVRADGS